MVKKDDLDFFKLEQTMKEAAEQELSRFKETDQTPLPTNIGLKQKLLDKAVSMVVNAKDRKIQQLLPKLGAKQGRKGLLKKGMTIE